MGFNGPQGRGTGITTHFCLVSKTSDQTVNNGAEDALTFDNDVTKTTAAMHSTSSNTSRLIAPTTDVYTLTWNVYGTFGVATSDAVYITVYKNGSQVLVGNIHGVPHTAGVAPPNYRWGGSGTVKLSLTANDYLEVKVFNDSGQTMTVKSGTTSGTLVSLSNR